MTAPPLLPKLCCVIVNFNGYADTIVCLDSLRAQDYGELSVVVIDNGSTNGSADRIRKAHPWVELHALPVNLGFPCGCNTGTRLAYAAGADLIWLLNNDTVAPPGTASAIVQAMLLNPLAGAIGSVLYYTHDPARVQAWGGGRIHLLTAYTSHFTAPHVFTEPDTFLTGACLAFPRAICEKVGIFYEGFFMYCDDSDLCLRIHRAGHPIVMAADTHILHKEGGSNPTRKPHIEQFATVSTMRLLRRHAPIPVLSIALYLLLRLAKRLFGGQWESLAAVWRGIEVFFRERNRQFTDQL